MFSLLTCFAGLKIHTDEASLQHGKVEYVFSKMTVVKMPFHNDHTDLSSRQDVSTCVLQSPHAEQTPAHIVCRYEVAVPADGKKPGSEDTVMAKPNT